MVQSTTCRSDEQYLLTVLNDGEQVLSGKLLTGVLQRMIISFLKQVEI